MDTHPVAPLTARGDAVDLDRIGSTWPCCPTNWRDFVEDYEFLRDQGISNERIAERFGVRLASLERRARRHGCWQSDRERVA